MTDDDWPEEAKLPRARSYLRAATWGLHEMVEKQHMGAGFIFHLAGVVALARAVPEALTKTDREQSDAHRKVIGDWFERTKPGTTPVIDFLKELRDVALHEGKLVFYATKAEINRNEVIIETGYDVGRYDEQGDRPKNFVSFPPSCTSGCTRGRAHKTAAAEASRDARANLRRCDGRVDLGVLAMGCSRADGIVQCLRSLR